MDFPNIYSLFRSQTAKYADKPVFFARLINNPADTQSVASPTRSEPPASSGGTAATTLNWRSTTWLEFENNVNNLACAFLAKGLSKGGSVAILAGNIPEWTIVDIAAIAAGGVGVGIYPTSSRDQCEYIINHSDAEFVVVDTRVQLEKVLACECPHVKEIFLIEHAAGTLSTGRVSAFGDLLEFGGAKREEFLPRVEEIGLAAKSDDVAIMVYTSGTTGQPKGAMLSHAYILNSVESLRRSVPIFDTDVSFSYLPGCHVAERISGIYNRLYNGATAYFVDDLSRLYQYMLEVKPTVFASLPRFFEKIHAKIAAEHGTESVDPQTVKDAFGGNIRLLTSGGAPLPAEIAQFFADAGVPILQAYGLTENICVAFNRADDFKVGTVGKAMPMCKIMIAGDGEILVKSPMMFSGYYKEPEKTAEMFDPDGWLKTGDLGELDEDGFLKITGRKKEIIVLSSGKNVAPALVENLVKESHLISHCFVHGDGRSYCVALVTLNQAEIGGSDITPELEDAVAAAIAKANARVSSSEQVKRYEILDRDFSPEFGEVTPTLKLKRDVVSANFKHVLDKLYEN
jgi:long-chain acyl-CoA synthetase